MSDYRRMLEDGYIETKVFDNCVNTRLQFLSNYIFDFTTYDGDMAELFASKALEVCAAVSDGKTFDYIKDPEQYRWFLIMCNMPFFCDRLSWGTSVRGAWWDHPHGGKIKFSSCGLFIGGKQQPDHEFTRDEWVDFIAAVISFGEAKDE